MRQTWKENGTIVNGQDYYPFGEVLRQYTLSDPIEKYMFTGKERDKETGYDYFGARYYDAVMGRWLSVDPLAYLQPSMTPYHYAYNNPINMIDRDGRIAEPVTGSIVVGSALVIAAGAALHHNYKMATDPAYRAAAIKVGNTTMTAVKNAVDSFVDGALSLFSSESSESEISSETNEQTESSPADHSNQDDDSAQDKRLSKGEIKNLKNGEVDIHDLKGGKNASKRDLFKNSKGDIKVKPKDGKGPGEETGLNINEFK